MAYPVESTFVESFRDTPRSLDQFAPRPTGHFRCNVPDHPSSTVSHSLVTNKHQSTSSVPPSLCSLPIPPSLMTTPRNKSKLSTMFSVTSDTDTSAIDSLCSSYEPDTLPQKSPPRKPTVSRLSFPFVKSAKSPLPRRAVTSASASTPSSGSQPTSTSVPASTQDPKSQDTLLGTPSPSSDSTSQRPSYYHQGYSRNALAHIKWFWAMREEKWEDAKSGPVRKTKPRLEVSFLETALDDPFSHPSSAAQKRRAPIYPTCRPQHGLPPMTIHPRRGDLFVLRDPYCIQVDRSFADLPSWTIGKMLWMNDIHLASQNRGHSGIEFRDFGDTYDEPESETEAPDTAASSIIFSDDSDATLVDSETESDLPSGGSNIQLPQDHDFGEKQLALSHDTFASSSSLQDWRPLSASFGASPHFATLYKPSWSRSAYPEPLASSRTCGDWRDSGKAMAGCPIWPRDWHGRWECMLAVAHRDQSTKRRTRFFIGDRPAGSSS